MTEQAIDEGFRCLLQSAYTPCRPDSAFKAGLLAELKAKQVSLHAAALPDDLIGTLLAKSYQPVEPRREFETRLLNNLKERQRNTRIIHRKTRRHTLFFSVASSVAAAAAVLFVVWVMPQGAQAPAAQGAQTENAALLAAIPDLPAAESAPAAQAGVSLPLPGISPADPANFAGAVAIPASFTAGNSYSTDYTVASAFAGPALAASARLLRNVSFSKSGEKDAEWKSGSVSRSIPLASGEYFRADGGMGHMEFPDGTLLSLSPDSVLETTDEGLSVSRGFVLVSVPETAADRFRLHFPERDLAVEPGTELAVMVEDPALFADGGAPAPMVMVVNRPDVGGGLALARGENGVGPLFASQMYRLDRYVTPNLPGRPLYDAEYQDLENLFKTETFRETLPMAAFAGGFSGANDMSYTATVLSPAGFTKKGGTWVADSYRGGPTVKVKYLSDAYFGLANERRDLARALALGSKLIVDAGGEVFYEIHE